MCILDSCSYPLPFGAYVRFAQYCIYTAYIIYCIRIHNRGHFYPCCRPNLTKPFLFFTKIRYVPGFDSSDSEAPPTISTVAFPVNGSFGGVDNRWLMLLAFEAQEPAGEKHYYNRIARVSLTKRFPLLFLLISSNRSFICHPIKVNLRFELSLSQLSLFQLWFYLVYL